MMEGEGMMDGEGMIDGEGDEGEFPLDAGYLNWPMIALGSLVVSAASFAGYYYLSGPTKTKARVRAPRPRRRKRKAIVRTAFACPADAQVCGLANNGNTCFLNSILQALSSLREFHRYVHELREGAPKSVLFKELEKVIRGETEDPIRVHRCVARVESTYSGRAQQDALELFTSLMAVIEKERRTHNPSDGLSNDPLPLTKASDVLKRGHSRVSAGAPAHPTKLASGDAPPFDLLYYSGASMPFRGTGANTKQCMDCGYTPPVRVAGFNSLSLSLAARGIPLSVEALLRAYVQPERIEGVLCERCSAEEKLADVQAKLREPKSKRWSTPEARRMLRAEEVKLGSFLETGIEPDRRKGAAEAADDGDDAPLGVLPRERKRNAATLERLELIAKCDVVKRELVLKLPPLLCLHLQRGLGATKDARHVRFGLILDLASLAQTTLSVLTHRVGSRGGLVSMDDFSQVGMVSSDSDMVYVLAAVVVHLGSGGNQGHYVTFRRGTVLPQTSTGERKKLTPAEAERWAASESEWYYASDKQVRKVSVARVLQAQAYLLFYERVACPIRPP